MLTAKKKIVKTHAGQEPAPFSWDNIQNMAMKYGKMVGGIAVVVIVIIVALYFYRAGQEEDNATASALLAQVQTLYQQGQYKLAIDGDQARGIPGLTGIVSEYGGTPTGQQAMLFLGNCYLYTDDYDKAIATFEDASPDNPLMKSAIEAGLGTAFYNKGDYAKAAGHYETAATMFENDLLSAERNLKAAEANLKAGNMEAAKELLVKVRDAKTTKFDGEITRITAQYDIELN